MDGLIRQAGSRILLPRVVLIGGGSSVGKTTLTNDLFANGSGPRVAVDDLVAGIADERLRFPSFPSVTTPEFGKTLFACLLVKQEVLEPHLHRVIARTAASDDGGVIEGEGVTPRLLVESRGDRVGGAIVVEHSRQRLLSTLRNRLPKFGALDEGRQLAVVVMNVLYNEWLAREAERLDVPTVRSQPWETLPQRFTHSVVAHTQAMSSLKP